MQAPSIDQVSSTSKRSLRALLSLHNIIAISILCSQNYATAETTYYSLHQKDNNDLSSSSSAAASFATQSKCNNPCLYIEGYSLQPLPQTACHQYVLCQDFQETYRYTCPDGENFHDGKKKCVPGEVECKCKLDAVEGSSINVEEVALKDEGEEVDNFGALTISRPQHSSSNNNDNINVQSQDEMQENNEEFTFWDNMACASTAGSDYAFVALPGCTQFVSCFKGKVTQKQTCAEGLIYDTTIGGCNWSYLTECTVTYPPSMSPTNHPTNPPTVPPPTKQPATASPMRLVTGRPTPPPMYRTGKPVTFPPFTESPTSSSAFPRVLDYIRDHVTPLNERVFRSYSKEGLSYRSYWFQYNDFVSALKVMSGKSITGKSRHVFYLGGEPVEWEYGLVNVAAFLSQAMAESISRDTCDEYNWEFNTDDFSDGVGSPAAGVKPDEHYAMSNACGQDGMNYQEFRCDADEAHMECEVDRNMKIQATTGEVYPNAPPPLTCRPRTTTDSFTGFWDVMNGKESNAFPYENSFGRTDVEGCCL